MKTIKTEINLYSYDELKGKAKERAFNEYFTFLCDNPIEYEDENGNMVYDDEEPTSQEVEDTIRMNEYLFFESGEMAII